MRDQETIKAQFRECFTQERYDGSYGTDASAEARQSFSELTGGSIVWSQVHGDFKNVTARCMFQPYQHWTELYDCVRVVLVQHAALNTEFIGDYSRARIMGETMAVLKAKHKANAPKCWLPIMNALRASGK
jgi:hypothetical protein